MKKITLIFIGFFCIAAFLNAQNTNPKTYFDDHFVGGLADDGDIIWAGVDNSLVKMNKTSGETIISYSIPISDVYPDSNRYVISISLDNNGQAWVSCPTGLESYVEVIYLQTFDGVKTWTEMTPDPYFRQLIIDKESKVWASSIFGSLYKYDGTGWIDYHPGPYLTMTLAVDSQNNKWLGLAHPPMDEGQGYLAKFDGTQFTLFESSYLYGHDGAIWSIGVSPVGTVWMGTYRNGLVTFDGTNWDVYNSSNSELPPAWVSLVTIEGSNIIWMSTENGLTRFDGENWRTFNTDNSILPSNNITSILIDENGTKWVGTDKGLISFRGNALGTSDEQNSGVQFKLYPNPANDFITLKMPSNDISSIVEIFNVHGKVVKSFKAYAEYNNIDISDLANGLYIIRLRTKEGIAVQKFVK